MKLREQLLKTGEVQRQLMKLQDELAGENTAESTVNLGTPTLAMFGQCLKNQHKLARYTAQLRESTTIRRVLGQMMRQLPALVHSQKRFSCVAVLSQSTDTLPRVVTGTRLASAHVPKRNSNAHSYPPRRASLSAVAPPHTTSAHRKGENEPPSACSPPSA